MSRKAFEDDVVSQDKFYSNLCMFLDLELSLKTKTWMERIWSILMVVKSNDIIRYGNEFKNGFCINFRVLFYFFFEFEDIFCE